MTLWLLWIGLLTTSPASAESPRPARPWDPKSGDVVVFLGDRITQEALYTRYVEDFLLTRFPGRDVRVVNAGVDGNRVQDALQRFSNDVMTHQPTVVAVQFGLGDVGRQALRHDLFQTFRHDIAELDQRIRDAMAVPIYLSPPMHDARASTPKTGARESFDREFFNATLAYYGVWLRDFANDAGAPFIDLHGPLMQSTRAARVEQPAFTFLPDGSHPDAAGQLVIAASFLDQLGFAQPLSAIRIARHQQTVTATADGGQVLSLQGIDPHRISFLWLAEALPWSLPEESGSASQLLQLAERFNRESLQVSGLGPGAYEVLIDNRLLGVFSDELLAEGITLQQRMTPQALQASRIAEANRERNETLVRPVREEWQEYQALQDLQRDAAARPGDRDLRARLADLEDRWSRAQARIAKHSAAAAEEFSRLQGLSQPVPREFVIRPVQTARVQGRVFLGGAPLSGAQVELHGVRGVTALGTTDAMGEFELTAQFPEGIPTGEAWLVVLAKMVLPRFVSLEKNGHRIALRAGNNEIELHFEDSPAGE